MILQVKNIEKSFDGIKLFDNLSFHLDKGTITALFGENGSGKTTLFNIITGFIKSERGEILYNHNSNIFNYSSSEISKLGIGRVWQRPRIFKNLSLQENLLISSNSHSGEILLNYFSNYAKIKKDEKLLLEKAMYLLEDVGLTEVSDKSAGELSFGQQKLLSIAMLLMNNSELLLLDEPFSGIHSKMIEHISELFITLKNQGKTIYIIEHNHSKAEDICDVIHFLAEGKISQSKLEYA